MQRFLQREWKKLSEVTSGIRESDLGAQAGLSVGQFDVGS